MFINSISTIFQYLFQCDQILYTIVPVSGKEDLEKAYVENSEGVRYGPEVSSFRTVVYILKLD